MSEIVKNEMDAIAAFAEDTEKRRSTLTLNELNYISDKQLHKKDGGGSGGETFLITSTETLSGSGVFVLDKTWKEIYDAALSGKTICFYQEYVQVYNALNYYSFLLVLYEFDNGEDHKYCVQEYSLGAIFYADTEDDYPTFIYE